LKNEKIGMLPAIKSLVAFKYFLDKKSTIRPLAEVTKFDRSLIK
jgi:hypothetical protein